MAQHDFIRIDRRALLTASAGFAAGALMPLPARVAAPGSEYKLVVASGKNPIAGPDYPATSVWCYNGRVPGPEIRIRQGQPARIVVENQLSEGTTVHWHGIRLPIAMDGVPGVSPPPIKPAASPPHELAPPHAATLCTHPRAEGLQQIARGTTSARVEQAPKPGL